MINVADAIQCMIDSASRLADIETMPISECLGRVLAEDIIAPLDVPPADNSAMDGYAFCYQDAVNNKFTLPLSQCVATGQTPNPLAESTAVRIFTGGELPSGADTVAIQEHCCEQSGLAALDSQVTKGENVRLKGQDICRGDNILSSGRVLRAQELGLIASLGISKIKLFKPLKIGFFTTGNELIQLGDRPQTGKIYDSNKLLISSLIKTMGMIPVDLGSAPDKLNATVELLKKASDKADIIMTSGGVSVGEADYVKSAVEVLGKILFWKVAIKPGKPILFASIKDRPFIGLPGNPASVFVAFHILLAPFLLKSQGCSQIFPYIYKAPALFLRRAENRQVYLRARLLGTGVQLSENQSSAVLSPACWGDAFVVQRPNITINSGDMVDVISFSSFGLRLT